MKIATKPEANDWIERTLKKLGNFILYTLLWMAAFSALGTRQAVGIWLLLQIHSWWRDNE